MSRACFWHSFVPCYRTVSQRRLVLNSGVESMGGRVKLAACLSVSSLAGLSLACAQQQVIGAPPEASNMKLVGTSDLQARSAYQPTIHHQGDRWIAYIGHHGGTDEISGAAQPADRQSRTQRHLDCRRHRSDAAPIPASHPGPGRQI